jgi:hypothetical protein
VGVFVYLGVQCHLSAAKADKLLKPPKSEWEGAAIRNSHTLTNNLLPLQGPSIPDSQYAAQVIEYWNNIAFRLKLKQVMQIAKRDGNFYSMQQTYFELVVGDLTLLLRQFALEASFSLHSRGGGRESNIQLVPWLLQMGVHLFENELSDDDCKLVLSSLAYKLAVCLSGGAPEDGVERILCVERMLVVCAELLSVAILFRARMRLSRLVGYLLIRAVVNIKSGNCRRRQLPVDVYLCTGVSVFSEHGELAQHA